MRLSVGVRLFWRAKPKWIAILLAVTAIAAGADSSPIVGTIGDKKITEAELDQRIAGQLETLRFQQENLGYEARRGAIEKLAENYLLTEAAKKENLSVDEYLKRQAAGAGLSERDARSRYDSDPRLRKQYPDFSRIKGVLIAEMQDQRAREARERTIRRLMKENPLRVEEPRQKIDYAGHPVSGPDTAQVTVAEFVDYESPMCAQAEPIVRELRKKYGDRVRFVNFDFPMSFRKNALSAAIGSRCAGDQGKFWQFRDLLLANAAKLSSADLENYAHRLNLDKIRFARCLSDRNPHDAVEQDISLARRLGVDATPAFFVNGRLVPGGQPLETFEQLIGEELSGAASIAARAQ